MSTMGSAIADVWDQRQEILDWVWTTLWSSVTAVWNWGLSVISSLWIALESLWSFITDVWRSGWELIELAWTKIVVPLLTIIFVGVPTVIVQGLYSALTTAWNWVWGPDGFLESIWSFITFIWNSGWELLGWSLTTTWSLITFIWKSGWELLEWSLTTTWSLVTGVLKLVWDIISWVFTTAFTVILAVLEAWGTMVIAVLKLIFVTIPTFFLIDIPVGVWNYFSWGWFSSSTLTSTFSDDYENVIIQWTDPEPNLGPIKEYDVAFEQETWLFWDIYPSLPQHCNGTDTDVISLRTCTIPVSALYGYEAQSGNKVSFRVQAKN